MSGKHRISSEDTWPSQHNARGLEGKVKGPLYEVAGAFTPVAARHARHTCSLRPQLASHAVRGR